MTMKKPQEAELLHIQPLTKTPRVPPELKGNAVAASTWRTYARLLVAEGVLTEWDLGTLRDFCIAQAEAMRAHEFIMENGFTYKTDKGNYVQRAEVGIAHRAGVALREYAKLLGLAPAVRGRMLVAPAPKPPGEFDKFMASKPPRTRRP